MIQFSYASKKYRDFYSKTMLKGTVSFFIKQSPLGP
jgi:hypothetical protein